MVIAALVALAVASRAWWLARRAALVPAGAPPHPSAQLSAEEAHQRGLQLARAGRALEAIPYFRRAVGQVAGSWLAHENLAAALGNGAQEARLHLGKDEIATRSSVERVAMMMESVRETEVADRLAGSPGDRATALFERARALQTWGFPVDALALFRAAAALAPQRADLAETLRRAEQALASGRGEGGPE